MTQKNAEMVIGRLVTDAEFRRRFRHDPGAALDELAALGVELNPVERRELATLDARPFELVASDLSARLQRAGFSAHGPDAGEAVEP